MARMGPRARIAAVITDRVSFPRLHENNHRQTSPADIRYNCIAWSAGDETRWWQPGVFGPFPVPREDCGIGALIEVFLFLGYEEGADESWQPDLEKVALYGSGLFYTHAARQLHGGKWTSKLGKLEDIEHLRPDDVAGGIYGEVVEIMKRAVSSRRMEKSSAEA